MERYIGFEIRALTNLLKREINQGVDQEHQCNTGMHGMIIDFLLNNQEREIFQRDFEEEFAMRRSTASRMLKLMENNGMIIRVPVSEDARLKKIVLTPEAIASHDSLMNSRIKIEEKIRKGISEDELDVFFQVIDKLKKNLE